MAAGIGPVSRNTSARAPYVASFPLLFFLVIVVVLHLVSPDRPITRIDFEPPLLLFMLNTIFVFLVGCIVSYLAMRSYLASGSLTILFFGCGLLSLGAGSLVAGWLITPWGANVTSTVFTLSAFLSSVFHMVGLVMSVMKRPPEAGKVGRHRKLALAYLGLLCLVGFIALAAVAGLLPTFFIRGTGPTILQQVFMAAALMLFVMASSSMMILFIQQGVRFLYWYSLGLALFSLDVFASFLQPQLGSLMGWMGRVSLYLAGVYFIVAVVTALREARTRGITLNERFSDIFRRSQRKMSFIFASMTDRYFELDREWRFTRINDQCLAYFKRKRQDFIGRSFSDVIPEVSGSVFEEEYRRAFHENVPVHFEARSLVVPGAWLDVHAYPTEEGLSVFMREVTELKRAEEHMKHLASFPQLNPNPVIEANTSGEITFYNPSCLKILEDLGLRRSDLNVLLPGDLDAIVRDWDGKTESDFHREVFLANRAFDETVHLVPQFNAVRIYRRDITEHKRAEELTRTTLERFYAVLSTMHSALLLVTNENRVEFANQAFCEYFQLNCSPEDLAGLTSSEMLAKIGETYLLPENSIARIQEMLDRGEPVKGEEVPMHEGRTYLRDFVPIHVDGRSYGRLWHYTDITEQKRAEEVLRQTHADLELCVHDRTIELQRAYDQLKKEIDERKQAEAQLRQKQKLEAVGVFAGGIAHDFNNVLEGIIGFTELVLEGLEPGSRERKRLELALTGAYRGRDLAKQILAFSRKGEQDKKPLSLQQSIEETLRLLRPSLPSTIEIRSRCMASNDRVLADPVQIHQILMNLCANAGYAMRDKGGVLDICISETTVAERDPVSLPEMTPGEYIVLDVCDTGCGMEPETVEQIFDPFFTTKEKGEGTGLGLSVVHGIVSDHDGYIAVESKTGQGSRFLVYLPKLEEPVGPADTDASPDATGEGRILVVDDEDILVDLNEQRLSGLGYDVVSTTNSMEALEIFRKEPGGFDLVITDQTMPNLTGIELAERLLKIRPDIPIILCTGNNESLSRERVRKAGIKGFLMKPFNKHQVAQAIHLALNANVKE